jgi:hypothetical protein
MGRLGLQRWTAELGKYGRLSLGRLVDKFKEKFDLVRERLVAKIKMGVKGTVA